MGDVWAVGAVSPFTTVHLPSVVAGRKSWLEHETIRRAMVIDEGVILHENILSFQKRRAQYPHESIV